MRDRILIAVSRNPMSSEGFFEVRPIEVANRPPRIADLKVQTDQTGVIEIAVEKLNR